MPVGTATEGVICTTSYIHLDQLLTAVCWLLLRVFAFAVVGLPSKINKFFRSD